MSKTEFVLDSVSNLWSLFWNASRWKKLVGLVLVVGLTLSVLTLRPYPGELRAIHDSMDESATGYYAHGVAKYYDEYYSFQKLDGTVETWSNERFEKALKYRYHRLSRQHGRLERSSEVLNFHWSGVFTLEEHIKVSLKAFNAERTILDRQTEMMATWYKTEYGWRITAIELLNPSHSKGS